MIKWIIIFLLALQIFGNVVEGVEIGDPLEKEYGTLKHVSILFRHGNRGPIRSYPLDPYKDYPWPNGFGQLINRGKKRLYDVGRGFRKRYHSFVNATYILKEIRTDSSIVDRCIMSAQCFLFGFYPAANEQIWLENETWQPIPIYTIPKAIDNKLQHSKPCKLRKILDDKEATDPIYETVYNEYKPTIEVILNETGIEVKNKTKAQLFTDLRHLASTLNIYVQNNFTLPNWTKDIFPGKLNAIVLKTIDNTFSLQKARIDAGPFLESVVKDMGQKIEDVKDEQKLHLYSGHDTTIRNIMLALKVYDGEMPPYGSSLIFELREKNSTNYVTVTYSYRKNDYESDVRLLDVPGCGLTCTYKEFYDLTKPLIPENWDRECEPSTSRSQKLTINAIIMTVFVYISYLLK